MSIKCTDFTEHFCIIVSKLGWVNTLKRVLNIEHRHKYYCTSDSAINQLLTGVNYICLCVSSVPAVFQKLLLPSS